MKKLLTILILLTAFTSCEKENLISPSELPQEIRSYLSTHFPNKAIVQSIIDQDGFIKTYDLILEGNFNLEFNRKKEIISIDGISKLPDSVIPLEIREYVTINYPQNVIISWKLDGKNQEVELDNELNLEFNMSGIFLRIDS